MSAPDKRETAKNEREPIARVDSVPSDVPVPPCPRPCEICKRKGRQQ